MKERNLTLDLLKVMFAFMIVGLHAGFLSDTSRFGYFITVEGVFRIAVPFFFIVNGFYFSDFIENNDLTKWLSRIFGLYVYWMLIYSPFWFRPESFNATELLNIIKTVMVGYFHLWYLPGMIGAGIITFLFRYNTKLGVVLAVVCFFVGVFIQYSGNYHFFSDDLIDTFLNTDSSHRNFLFFGFPFFFIGFLFEKYKPNPSFSTLCVLSIVGVCLLLLESVYNFSNPSRDGGFDNYLSLILACPSVFLLTLKSKRKIRSKSLANLSTGIYFIHPFILSFLYALSSYQATILTGTCIFLSVLVSYLLVKISEKSKSSYLL